METNKISTKILLILSLLIAFCSVSDAADWPHWRGPNYNGVSAEKDWDPLKIKDGVKPLWRASIGIGFSAISVSNGRTYAMGNTGVKGEDETKHNDVIFCFDAETGKEIWKYSYPQPLDPKYYEGGALATPTLDGDKVYTISKDGKVFCLDAKTGKVIWQKNLSKELSIKRTTWGHSASPVVIDNMVIYNAGSMGVALNKDDGSLIWAGAKEPGGYATAVPFTSGNQKCIAMFSFSEIIGLDAATGKELWRYPWKTKHDVNAADPIIVGNKIFVSSGYGIGCALLKIEKGNVTEIWHNKNMLNKMNGSVLWDGYIYGIDEGGELRCLDFKTGEIAWAQGGFGMGSLMVADGKLIVLGEKGNLVVAKATADGYKVISEAEILSPKCWSVPVLANGRIYARNAAGDMVCLDVAACTKAKIAKCTKSARCDKTAGSSAWSQFRGPNRDGWSKETGLLSSWPEGGPSLLWKTAGLGKGYSSVAIVNGKIFTMGDRENEQFLMALDLNTHKQLWAIKVSEQWKDGGPRCTPTVEGGLVYAIGTHGDFVCVEENSGKLVWRKNFAKDFGGKMMSGWGYCESPLIDGDKVLCTPGGKDAAIVALNKKTGELIWKAVVPDIGQRGKDGAGYASIVVYEIGGVRQYLQITGRGLISIGADNGKFLWSYNKIANSTANITNVIVQGEYVFCTTSYKTGSALLRIIDGTKAEEIYFLGPDKFENHHGGVVLVDGYIYGGDGLNKGAPICLELKTGKIMWKAEPLGKGSAAVVYAEGHLYFRYQDGQMFLIEATPKSFNVKGKFKAASKTGPAWPHPAIFDRKLYLRDNDMLLCYDISKKAAVTVSTGNSWAQWHGPNRDNKSTEKGLLKKWPEQGPKLLWSTGELGAGFSTVSIADGTIYTTGTVDEEGVLFALDMAGELKWKQIYGTEWTKSFPGAKCSPTVDHGYVYVVSGMGLVACFDAKTGDKKWIVDAFSNFEGKYHRWGIAESPLIVGNKVICTPGGEKAAIVALDKETGKTIWASESIGEKAAYCSPIVIERGGRNIIVMMLENSLVGLEAESGKILWSDKFGKKGINPVTPIYRNGCIYTTSGYDDGSVMYELSADGNKITRKWTDEVLDNHHGGVVEVDGYIYGANWKGNANGDWICLDWETGKVMYETQWLGKGAITYADTMLYCYEEKEGNLALVRATPEKFDIVSSFKIPMGTGKHWAHPVILDAILYIRHGDTLMAYDIKAK